MPKKIIENKQIARESIQWVILHFKLIFVVGLSYLGMDKIIEDLPFYEPSATNMIHTLNSFNLQVFCMDLVENMLLLFLVYVMVTAVTMTLNQRPLTVNAISIALGRKRKELIRVTLVVGLIISFMSMVLSSVIIWLNASYWLSEFVIVFATAMFSLFIIFAPHEMLIKNNKMIESIKNSFGIGKRYFLQLIRLTFCVGLVQSFLNHLLEYLFAPSNYFYMVFRAFNSFGLIILVSVMVTIFYYQINQKS